VALADDTNKGVVQWMEARRRIAKGDASTVIDC
jgi:hypothetical protein